MEKVIILEMRIIEEDYDPYGGDTQTTSYRHAVFTDPSKVGEEVLAQIESSMVSAEEWNTRNQYEDWVHPHYAEACMWYHMLSPNVDRQKHSLRSAVDGYRRAPKPYASRLYRQSEEVWGSIFERKEDVWPSILDDFEGPLQKAAHDGLPKVMEWWAEFQDYIKGNLPDTTFILRYGYDHMTFFQCTFHVFERADPQALADMYGVRLNETTTARACRIETERYLSKEGQAERKRAAERERELRTMMGEGGYTSYSRSDDGTIRMWRD